MTPPRQPTGRKMTPRIVLVRREDPATPIEAESTPVPSGEELSRLPERERWEVVSSTLQSVRDDVRREGKATRNAFLEVSEQIGTLARGDAGHAKTTGEHAAEVKRLEARLVRDAARGASIKTLGGALGVGVAGAFAADPSAVVDFIRTVLGG